MARFGKVVNNEMEYAPSSMTDKQELYGNGYQPVNEGAVPSDYNDYEYTFTWVSVKKVWQKQWNRGEHKPDTRTAAEKREEAYETRKCVEWDNQIFTVDEAVKLWYEYTAEGRDMSALSTAIETAKNKIREEFPDENQVSEEKEN